MRNMQITIYVVLQWVTIFMEFIWRIQLCIVIQVQMIHKWLFGLSGIFFYITQKICVLLKNKSRSTFLVCCEPLVWKQEWE